MQPARRHTGLRRAPRCPDRPREGRPQYQNIPLHLLVVWTSHKLHAAFKTPQRSCLQKPHKQWLACRRRFAAPHAVCSSAARPHLRQWVLSNRPLLLSAEHRICLRTSGRRLPHDTPPEAPATWLARAVHPHPHAASLAHPSVPALRVRPLALCLCLLPPWGVSSCARRCSSAWRR